MVEERAGKRIAILLPDLRPGGAERLHLHLAQEWLRQGVAVDFVLRNAQGELLTQLPAGATVVDLGAARVRNVLSPLARYLRHARPDALLAAMWPLTVVAPLAARLTCYRGVVAVSEHSPLSLAYRHKGRAHALALRASTGLGYRLADVCIGVSSGVADDMARLSGLPRGRFTVIHNPAATGKVSAQELPRPEVLQAIHGPLLLSVGTLKPVKRQDLLIEAYARLSPDLRATLCILGEGPQRAVLERQVAELGLAGRVLLPGYVADPAPWYAHADVFVLSSDYEGFGNVIVEAMEQGVPIVSTDCPSGPREILVDGQYGTLVPVGEPDAMAQAMQDALTQTHDKDALKTRAADFSVAKAAAAYLDLLRPDCGQHGSRTQEYQ